ncbi:uncharacterized protein LOC103511357 [Diaphorina citri]|uniref:Uncharacterized protein LOC103511357 n=1 Tax=Diaphorina citri TaxID=121845 RepID=A0A1S3D4L2_DIACI|nr:uncharacterized protein LOC103511357 [Diaphorina citri]
METFTKKVARSICCVTKKHVKRGFSCMRSNRRKIQELNSQDKVLREIVIPTKMYSSVYVNDMCRSDSSCTIITFLEPETLDNLVNQKLENVRLNNGLLSGR